MGKLAPPEDLILSCWLTTKMMIITRIQQHFKARNTTFLNVLFFTQHIHGGDKYERIAALFRWHSKSKNVTTLSPAEQITFLQREATKRHLHWFSFGGGGGKSHQTFRRVSKGPKLPMSSVSRSLCFCFSNITNTHRYMLISNGLVMHRWEKSAWQHKFSLWEPRNYTQLFNLLWSS